MHAIYIECACITCSKFTILAPQMPSCFHMIVYSFCCCCFGEFVWLSDKMYIQIYILKLRLGGIVC